MKRSPISRFDADDSRLLKKEFLRLIRQRTSIIRTMCDSDEEALALAKTAADRDDGSFLSVIESLIWQGVAMRIEHDLKSVKQADTTKTKSTIKKTTRSKKAGE